MASAEGEPQILSLGSINADMQLRAERLPASGETLLGEDFVMLSGGKAANVAYIARLLGAPARLFGRVGEDALRQIAIAPLEKVGVDLEGVQSVGACCTGVAMIAVRPDGEKAILLAGNANDAWSKYDAADALELLGTAPAGSVLVVDLEVPTFVVRNALALGRKRDYVTVLDPSPAERMSDDLYPLVSCLTPNPVEAQMLTGIAVEGVDSAMVAGRRLIEKGVGAAFIKLQDGGCVMVSANDSVHVPAWQAEVTDKTGAGDAFAGALAVALLEQRHLDEAAAYGVAAASFAVTRYGSQPSYPERGDVERLLATPRP